MLGHVSSPPRGPRTLARTVGQGVCAWNARDRAARVGWRPLSWALVAVAGCADPGAPGSDGPLRGVLQDGAELVLELSPGVTVYTQTCLGDLVTLAQDGEELELDRERVGSRWTGYVLDGRPVPATCDEGCDLVSCEKIPRTSRVPLVAYRDAGWVDTPDELEPCDWVDPVDQVVAVESFVVTGEIEVTLHYYTHSDCPGDALEASATITVE